MSRIKLAKDWSDEYYSLLWRHVASADKEMPTFQTVFSSPLVSTSKISTTFRNVDQSTQRDVTRYTNFQQHRCDGLKSRVEPCCGPQADSHSEHKLSFRFKVPRNIKKKVNKSKTGRPAGHGEAINCKPQRASWRWAPACDTARSLHNTGVGEVAAAARRTATETRTVGNSVRFEKLTVPQLLKKFPTFYGTRKAHYHIHNSPPLVPILSQMKPVHASRATLTIHFLIVYSHLRLGLPSGFFP